MIIDLDDYPPCRRLKIIRVAKNINGALLCRKAKVSREYLSNFENGWYDALDEDQQARIAGVLGIPAPEIFAAREG